MPAPLTDNMFGIHSKHKQPKVTFPIYHISKIRKPSRTWKGPPTRPSSRFEISNMKRRPNCSKPVISGWRAVKSQPFHGFGVSVSHDEGIVDVSFWAFGLWARVFKTTFRFLFIRHAHTCQICNGVCAGVCGKRKATLPSVICDLHFRTRI